MFCFFDNMPINHNFLKNKNIPIFYFLFQTVEDQEQQTTKLADCTMDDNKPEKVDKIDKGKQAGENTNRKYL